jgi:murein DD-endopeptidase MepM/ murein hydrolase activator NlpD
MKRVKGISLALAAVLAGAINLAEAKGESKEQASNSGESASASNGGKSQDQRGIQLLSQPGLTTTTAPSAPPETTPPAPPAAAAPVETPVLEPEPPPPALLSVPWAPMVCPVQGTPGHLSYIDSWGFARSGGRAHKGTDLMTDYGTWTVAPVDGVVEHGENGLGGLTWKLYGDDGNMYYGAHLSAYENVGAGWVPAGTVIGYVGTSGNAAGTPPHLHFEFHPGGGGAAPSYDLLNTVCEGGY